MVVIPEQNGLYFQSLTHPTPTPTPLVSASETSFLRACVREKLLGETVQKQHRSVKLAHVHVTQLLQPIFG